MMLWQMTMLGAIDWAQDSLMMDDTELNRLLEDVAAPDALAGEDYGDAWVPESFSADEADLIRHGAGTQVDEHIGADGAVSARAMSTAAIDQQRRREELIKAAKTEQDRIAARRDTNLYRLSLAFSGDEADIVKGALGEKPAERLLEMCKAAQGV